MKTRATKSRYQIVEQIGAGDFATVYAAQDKKLGREVAIKQLHRQFLADKDALARYWQEAQLLVVLEHPNVTTIFDVVRSRGYLVLELMQGSLQQIYAGQPAPVEDVRQAIMHAANGLHCLHEYGIIHGDIKPGNLLLSRQNVVKLGDFGLARRANDLDGSLLKGTTKYMAPELVASQFGDVGPASDLYSLGFTALALLCGDKFDSLFPELQVYGRDQQMAWMMWHCAADRKVPKLAEILEGVPADLTQVIEKLTCKDQSQRFRSAVDVITDLNGNAAPVAIGSAVETEALQIQYLKKKRRRRAVAAFVFSLVASMAMLFYFNRPAPESEPVAEIPQPVSGILQNILLANNKLVMAVGSDWQEVTLFPEDRIVLNRKERQLRDLELGDRLTVRTLLDPQRRTFRELLAFRPETHRGHIKSIQADEGQFVFAIYAGEETGAELVINVPPQTTILLNGQTHFQKQPVRLATLRSGDEVAVEHSASETGIVAYAIEASRVVQTTGIVRDVDLQSGRLTMASGESDSELTTLPFDSQCEVTLNGLRFINKQLLKPHDLKPSDAVVIRHDQKIVSINTQREFREAGYVENVAIETETISISSTSDGQSRTFAVNENSKIFLGDEPVPLVELRPGDQVELLHNTPGAQIPQCILLNATRPADPSKWAILIVTDRFDDESLPTAPENLRDVKTLYAALTNRYAVPREQAVLIENQSRILLQQALASTLAKIPAKSEVYVYLSTRAAAIPKENVFLAATGFDKTRVAESGVKLDWIIDQLDACASTQKLLLLDVVPDNTSTISSSQMIELIQATRRGGYPKSSHVLASSIPTDDSFIPALTAAFSGAADQQRDNRLDIHELSEFINSRPSAGADEPPAQLFLPDDHPPRYSDEARNATLALLAHFSKKKIDSLTVRLEAEHASKLSGGQPEPMLACGLLLLQANECDNALEILEPLRLQHPDLLLVHRAVIWAHFCLRDYKNWLSKSTEIIGQIQKRKESKSNYAQADLEMIEWFGRFHEVAQNMTWTRSTPDQQTLGDLLAAVGKLGVPAEEAFAAGKTKMHELFAEQERNISPTDSQSRIAYKKRLLGSSVIFSTTAFTTQIRDLLETE